MSNIQLRSCELCKAEVPASSVKLYPKSNEQTWMLCEPCCEKMKQRRAVGQPASKQEQQQPIRNIVQRTLAKVKSAAQSESGSDSSAAAEYLQLHCRRCNYHYRVDEKKAGTRVNPACPYCGKGDQVERK
ncbi:MAG: hypothetical protein AABX13_01250 [Nanoarchaeota archaeon]